MVSGYMRVSHSIYLSSRKVIGNDTLLMEMVVNSPPNTCM